MANYTEIIPAEHSRRCSYSQKQSFLFYARHVFHGMGYSTASVVTDRLGIRSESLAAGSVYTAKHIVIAHYDTPRRSFIPMPIYPLSPAVTRLIAILPALVLMGTLFAVMVTFGTPGWLAVTTDLMLAFALFACFENPANANRNTSGICALFMLAETHPADTAFILTDNGELFSLGSRTLEKAYGMSLADKTVVILDCVGVGDTIAVLHTPAAAPVAEAMCADSPTCTARQIKRLPREGKPFKKALYVSVMSDGRISATRSPLDTSIQPSAAAAVAARIRQAADSGAADELQ